MLPNSVEGMLKYPLVFLVGFLATYLLTPLVGRMARSCGMMDRPADRHIHKKAVPRCGFSVFLGFHLACAAIFLVPWKPFVGALSPLWWWHYFIISSILLLVGALDDRFDLRPGVKLAGQCVVALLAYMFNMRVGGVLGIDLPLVVDVVVTVGWFVVLINAFNLIDGIDGLATGLAAIAALGLAGSFLFRHLPGDALLLFGLIGACLAFLRYNFQPASIFLGDSGSMFLGLTIAAVALSSSAKGTAVASVGVPLLAVGVPVFDTFLAVWRRSVRRLLKRQDGDGAELAEARVFQGDVDHVHHRLMQRGLSQRAVASWLYALSVALVGIGLLSMMYNSHAIGIYILAFVVASYVSVRHLARIELWASGRAILQGMERPSGKSLAVLGYIPSDVLLLTFALAVTTTFSDHELATRGFRIFWFDRIPLWVGVPFLVLFAAKTYQRAWTRASSWDFMTLVLSLLIGILLAAGLGSLIHEVSLKCLVQDILIYTGVGLPLVVGSRLLPRAVEDAMGMATATGSGEVENPVHTLILGANNGCIMYLRELGTRAGRSKVPVHVTGILSRDRDLCGRLVHGFRVLGWLEAIPDAAEKKDVKSIVVTESMNESERKELLVIAAQCGINVLEQCLTIKEMMP